MMNPKTLARLERAADTQTNKKVEVNSDDLFTLIRRYKEYDARFSRELSLEEALRRIKDAMDSI